MSDLVPLDDTSPDIKPAVVALIVMEVLLTLVQMLFFRHG
jgi:hypothetical protein